MAAHSDHPAIDTRAERILSALERARERIESLESGNKEPIAVIAIGCRFPGGVVSPVDFWKLLEAGRDGTSEVPGDRWNWRDFYSEDRNQVGTIYTSRGGFLDSIDSFDASFFGISPREAEKLDPQQRLLLEVAWETLENGGVAPDTLKGTRAGVFVGMSTDDYADICVHGSESLKDLDLHSSLGNSRSVAAGRIAAFLGMQGPVMQLDTACSSSLIAVHLACRSLQTRECDIALAGGVNIIASPLSMMSRCRMQALSRDGRCKTFDATADGYGQGEGCGLVLLKRLSRAQADGDEILAVIRGSATNHNGPSSGITVPNEDAQVAVIEAALSDAHVDKSEVGYIEAHGTGTVLGDPLEINALARVFGSVKSKEDPLLIGSVKANIGHLEAAAGVACLIKAVLSVAQGEIPAHIGMSTPNPAIDWESLPIKVTQAHHVWNSKLGTGRVAGVSSFGISGSNAHVVVSSYQGVDTPSPVLQGEPLPTLIPISGSTETACRAVAKSYASYLEKIDSDSAFERFVATTQQGRAHLMHRSCIVAHNKEEARTKFSKFANEKSGVHRIRENPAPVFLFTGQGSQYSGMGKHLFQDQRVFRETILACEDALSGALPVALTKVLFEAEHAELLNQTLYTQPALFALEYALATLFQYWGVRPAAVIGHSVGEYVAAAVASVFSMEAGIKLIAARARLMQSLPTGGSMIALGTDEATARKAINLFGESSVSIAAINSPTSVVISGVREEVKRVAHELGQSSVPVKELSVSHAFHSSLMDPILKDFSEVASKVEFARPKIPIVSNRSGKVEHENIYSAAYWVHHLRESVLFGRGVESLLESGYETFLELGPRPVLLALGKECAGDKGASRTWIPTLRPGADSRVEALTALGACHCEGVSIAWQRVTKTKSRRDPAVPTYPWERKRYWIVNNVASKQALLARRSSSPTASGPFGLDDVISRYSGRLSQAERDVLNKVKNFCRDESIPCELYQVEWVRQSTSIREVQNTFTRTVLISSTKSDCRKHIATLVSHSAGEIASLEISGATAKKRKLDLRAKVLEASVSEAGVREKSHVVYIASRSRKALAESEICGEIAYHVSVLRDVIAAILDLDSTPDVKLSIIVHDLSDYLLASALEALGRSIALEHPSLWHASVSLDDLSDETKALARPLALLASAKAHETIRNEKVLRLTSSKSQGAGSREDRFAVRADRSYLITGGAGVLGQELCSWFLEHGAKHIVIVGRRSKAAIQTIDRPEICYVQCDVSDEAALVELLSRFGSEYPSLAGVFHLAGTAVQSAFTSVTDGAIESMLRSKVSGALLLAKATRDLELDCFALFSSLASVLGAHGHAVYAAANGLLDALAQNVRDRGLNATSISFGPWQHGIFGDGAVIDSLGRQGIATLSSEEGFQSLDLVVGQAGYPHTIVAKIDWLRFRKAYESQAEKPLLLDINHERGPVRSDPQTENAGVHRHSLSENPESRRSEISDILVGEIVGVLRLGSCEDVDRDLGFAEMGMDSLLAVELKERIEAALGIKLPKTSVFNYPTVNRMSVHIADLIFAQDRTVLRSKLEVVHEDISAPTHASAGVEALTLAELEAVIDAEFAAL